MILAVDADGTLWEDRYPDIGKINKRTVSYVKYMQREGHKLILWTCRSGEQLEAALKVCAGLGIKFDAVNDNLPEIIEKYKNNSRKIYADFYLDDRTLTPIETYDKWYEESLVLDEMDIEEEKAS